MTQGDAWQGTVLAAQANYYQVHLDQGTDLLCTRRTRLKKIGTRVLVGDRVVVVEPDWQGQRGAIAEVLARRSELDRPPIANADQVLLVFALASPPLDPIQLSRFLVTAEVSGLRVLLCLNKADLVSEVDQQHWRSHLNDWGYSPVLVSVQAQTGLRELGTALRDNTSVLAGPSGVGKSSLINILIPDRELRVGALSEYLGRGRHTTRHVELFELPEGGLLADTPGFNQPALTMTARKLAACFPEIRARQREARCQFTDCIHQEEPGCVVRGDWERYPHYQSFLEEVLVWQAKMAQVTDPDAALKTKFRALGATQDEPRLEAKRYRRPSRRTQRQALEAIYQDVGELDSDAEE
ncbi:small ribosomal subunit biogenesis GTPase RsgA [Leptolyngbya sp. FACHB-261]|uniref:small ribosomal subunit biogenesis GTPase RsgA n=1 Tax=Leptolyngbya sp. FACHB-261 TaxID=2692806 RepID=UPI001682F1B8|nr:small ribosomal subunit biogenesis GTPase RsgA [Leptolyngbya sp. FACHB-261]MBD2105109.1 small ribosomal subunit biogenesis GTPase RsgA [Leptolyngbya sp. FACHB-261]